MSSLGCFIEAVVRGRSFMMRNRRGVRVLTVGGAARSMAVLCAVLLCAGCVTQGPSRAPAVAAPRDATPTVAAPPASTSPAAAPTTATPPVDPGVELPEGQGRDILVSSCLGCHQLQALALFKGFYTRDSWRDLVLTMKENGAEVDDMQVEVLADYLEEYFGPGTR